MLNGNSKQSQFDGMKLKTFVTRVEAFSSAVKMLKILPFSLEFADSVLERISIGQFF